MYSFNEIRVAIADDHPIVRSGIIRELNQHEEISIVGEAKDGDETLSIIQHKTPEILLLDVAMPGKKVLPIIVEIKKLKCCCKIIILTAHNDIATFRTLIKAGVEGYVLKEEDSDSLIEAIRAVYSGKKWISTSLAVSLAQQIDNFEIKPITQRELEVLRLLAEGKSNKEIGFDLHITSRTVEFHLSNIYNKLDIRSRIDAVLWYNTNFVSNAPVLTNERDY
jgi:DNA-binding NarL/FixJ family response regulator